MTKLCPHIIVEGTRLTGKTELLRALTESPALVGDRRYWYHNPVVSAEWSGISREPWGENLIEFAPEREGLVRECFDAWLRVMELQPHYGWFVDRFHLSTMAWQRAARRREIELWDIDARLAELGFAVVFCTRDRAGFEAARERRLEVSGKPEQYDDLSVFEREQRAMRELCEQSELPIIEIDVAPGEEADAAEQIAGGLDELGLLSV